MNTQAIRFMRHAALPLLLALLVGALAGWFGRGLLVEAQDTAGPPLGIAAPPGHPQADAGQAAGAPADAAPAPASPAAEPGEDPAATPPPATTGYVGNTRSRIFHAASCRYAACKTCTARFDTVAQALAAGYAPCRNEKF